MKSSEGISRDQLRMMYALARENGMSDEELHDKAEALTNRKHLSQMTRAEAGKVIDSFLGGKSKGPMYRKKERAITRATQGQVDMIFGLARKMGWLEQGYGRLNAFLKARYGVDHIDWLPPDAAQQCIEAMKAMLQGGRQERRAT